MNLLLWGITLGTVGKLVLGWAVLRVHMYMYREGNIDGVVRRAIKREEYITLAALILIVLGFVLELVFYQGSTELLSCTGSECAGAIQAAFQR
jgi:hypothetical protein